MKKGQRVKVYFKNGIIEDGFVESWSKDVCVIRAIYGNNKLVITNSKESVFAVRIINDEQIGVSPVVVSDPVLKEYEPDARTRAIKLASIYREKIAEEKRRAAEQLSNSSLNFRQVKYGYPKKI